MRKMLTMVCVLVLTFPLSGCWDRKEVNELALVMAKGIDQIDDHKIRVSVQIAIPSQVGGSQSGSGKGESGKSFFVVSATGRTVREADEHIQRKLPRRLYLPHLRVILIGDRMARSGLEQVLDHFGRNPPNRLRSAILVAKDSDALPLLQTTYPLESLSGEAVRKLERQLTGTNTTLMNMLQQASAEGRDSYASAVSLISDDSQGSETSQENKEFAFNSTAIFHNLKLVGYLDAQQTVALQWLNGRLKYTTLTMQVPNTKGNISIDLSHSRRRAQILCQGKNIIAQYELSGAAMLTENNTGLDADNPKVTQKFQATVNRYVAQTVTQCLSVVNQKMDADSAGIGQMVYRQHPYMWQEIKDKWEDQLPKVRIVVKPNVKLIEGGKSGAPIYGKPTRGIQQEGQTSTQQIGGGSE